MTNTLLINIEPSKDITLIYTLMTDYKAKLVLCNMVLRQFAPKFQQHLQTFAIATMFSCA